MKVKEKRRLTMRGREALDGYLFMAPAVLGFLFFTLLPMLASLGLGFTAYDLLSAPQWIGLGNYKELFADPFFWQSLRVTATFALFGLPLSLIVALGVALLMNQAVPAIALWRTIYVLPSVISGVAVAVLWRWLLNPEFGLFNLLLGFIGIKGPNWLGTPEWALPSLILMALWGTGNTMLILLAGLQGIPTDLYEAVEIDGGGALTKLRAVTLPLLTPVILFIVVTGLIYAFQYFTEAYVLTKGGPENATLFYTLYLYRNAFNYFKMGYAAALAWMLFLLVLVLSLAVLKSTPMWVYYEGERRRV